MARVLLGACLVLGMFVPAVADDPGARPITGSHQIRNHRYADADLVLRPRDASSAERNPIVLYRRTSWKCLTWKVDPSAADGEALINHFTNKTFAPASKPSADAKSVPVVQVSSVKPTPDDQKWQFVPAEGSTYRIVNTATGWVLTAVKGDDGGYGIVIAPWAGTDEQRWEVLDAPEHFTG